MEARFSSADRSDRDPKKAAGSEPTNRDFLGIPPAQPVRWETYWNGAPRRKGPRGGGRSGAVL